MEPEQHRRAAVPEAGEADRDAVDGAPPRFGWFRFYFDDERWEWSSEVQMMHGYAPGTVTPTTELVLSHKHPDDYAEVTATFDDVRQRRRAFSSRHRIVDAQGAVHHMLVVADTFTGEGGRVIGTHGHYVDLTPVAEREQQRFSDAIAEVNESRAVIEQAKGMLMGGYGITADAAFELLRWRSQETNVKLRRIAERIVTDFVAAAAQRAPAPLPRSVCDNLLLTAHLGVDGAGDPGTDGHDGATLRRS